MGLRRDLAAALAKRYLGDMDLRNVPCRTEAQQSAVQSTLTSLVIIALILCLTGIAYQRYFKGAQFIHFLLGPAAVALGIPLYEKFAHVRRNLLPMIVALTIGSLTAVGSTIL